MLLKSWKENIEDIFSTGQSGLWKVTRLCNLKSLFSNMITSAFLLSISGVFCVCVCEREGTAHSAQYWVHPLKFVLFEPRRVIWTSTLLWMGSGWRLILYWIQTESAFDECFQNSQLCETFPRESRLAIVAPFQFIDSTVPSQSVVGLFKQN